MNSSNRIPLVKNRTVDISSADKLAIPFASAEVSYSVIFYAPQFKWIALKSSGLKTTDDLESKTVAVTQGTSASQFVAKLNTEKSLGMKILQGKDHAESFRLVETGRASAFMEDDILLAGLKAGTSAPDNLRFCRMISPATLWRDGRQRAARSIKQVVDDALTEAMKSGLYDKLYTKWIESPIHRRTSANSRSRKSSRPWSDPSDKASGQWQKQAQRR